MKHFHSYATDLRLAQVKVSNCSLHGVNTFHSYNQWYTIMDFGSNSGHLRTDTLWCLGKSVPEFE